MLVSKRKYEELQQKYNELEQDYEIESKCCRNLENEFFKLQKLAQGDFGDSIDYLIIKWGTAMWKRGMKPLAGQEVLMKIKRDLHNLVGKLVTRKK